MDSSHVSQQREFESALLPRAETDWWVSSSERAATKARRTRAKPCNHSDSEPSRSGRMDWNLAECGVAALTYPSSVGKLSKNCRAMNSPGRNAVPFPSHHCLMPFPLRVATLNKLNYCVSPP